MISQAEFDRAVAEQKQTDAQVGEIRATIERKTIRAPFSGILGIRQVNLGQYLDGRRSGRSAAVAPSDLCELRRAAAGRRAGARRPPCRVTAGDVGGVAFIGRVTAIDSIVDQATRNVQVQATLANPDGQAAAGHVRADGMVLGASRSVVALPASAISYAPFGDSVFVVTDLKGQNGQTYRGVRQQFVKLGGARGDQVAVVSGVKAGEEVVTSGVFKLRNGAAVLVNNKVQPANKRAPKPEDS